MIESTVYIDEAGDLGSGRGTRWFVLTAVVVDKNKEPEIRNEFGIIKGRLNLNTIHFRELRDFYKKAYVVNAVNSFDFTYMNVISDTNLFDPHKLTANAAYNFHCKLLLERVSWFMKDTGRVGNIVLSARGTARDNELINYITEKLLPYPRNNIESSTIRDVTAKPAGTWDMLQLADICATTTFFAHEQNGWGFQTPCYFQVLKSHLFRRNGIAEQFGVKYYLSPGEERELLGQNWPCRNVKGAPGATTT